jgi:hypothetical protein
MLMLLLARELELELELLLDELVVPLVVVGMLEMSTE